MEVKMQHVSIALSDHNIKTTRSPRKRRSNILSKENQAFGSQREIFLVIRLRIALIYPKLTTY